MDYIDSLKNASVDGLNRYLLTLEDSNLHLDVLKFEGHEGLSELYHYTINFTCLNHDIQPETMLRKGCTLIMQFLPDALTGKVQLPVTIKTVHGIISSFRRLTGSRDQVSYEIALEPFLSLLSNQHRSHRFFVNTSVPDVIEQVLTEHGLKNWEFEFRLKNSYPIREQINQYQESDLAFIQRLLAEVGIFYFFTVQQDTCTEVIHFGDKQSAMTFGKQLGINSPSGMSDSGSDSIWELNVEHNVVEASVTTKDYNHRSAHTLLNSAPADMTRGEGSDVNYGNVYHYQMRHLERGDKFEPAPETANFYARLDHERFLSHQTLITAKSTDATLSPAQVLTITDCFPPTLPVLLQQPVLIRHLKFTGSRKKALLVELTAIPYSETICWRPPLLPRPKVTGTMTARVTSAKSGDAYAWLNAAGLYRVKFDADLDGKNQGQESMPVRLAKPYGGDTYGFHFPLIRGTEVAIAFHEGDPDRPYIAYALHDSRHPDPVTELNYTRNVIRTPKNNKLRMEDKAGEEHIKLSTEYGGKTQLNMGHNVDAQRVARGEGAELRTDDWVTIRGGKGIFLSADRQSDAQGAMLEMEAAVRQLELALSLARSLSKVVQRQHATPGDTDSQARLNETLDGLKQAGLLAHAPNGIGILSPAAVRVASGGQSVGIMSGRNTDISAAESVTIAAVEAVSLFAQSTGMQLIAGSGSMELQAQSDTLNAQAKRDVTITSSEGRVEIASASELILKNRNGSYIKIVGDDIELGCKGNILLRSTNMQKMGPATITTSQFNYQYGYGAGFTLKDSETGKIKTHTRYRITTAEGEVYNGTSGDTGKTLPVYTMMPASLKVEFPDEEENKEQ
ncbi:type VI secretion system Vgr family protein [Leclercia adecarboxylata]|uniref:type VI secretion system Vgr family protein n=1 Tax=Leclercia adecarboxylata TaxID=83655 RepID=UPI001118DF6B|nr:type VI secretion system Vgr family protein [Leclercia adecarboxylata]QCZ28965.1 type VI secretion system tip protein VgrG [Leclercia adecarboxylata]